MLNLTYNYGTTANNGNVLSMTYAGGGLSYTQSYGYDALNRLTTSNENSGASWSQTNGYDRYGNRWIDYGGSQSLYFNTSNNRITNAGYAYDAAGNLTNDTIHTYGFDAENKIKTVDGVSGVYSYDGDGNRVRKNFAAGEKARMVYSLRQLIAEYDLSNGALKKEYVYGAKGLIATIEPTSGTRYTTTDHLGSPRVVTNSSAGVVSRHDYMPFGVELGAGTGGRTTGMGFSVADGLRQKFTSKEREIETGLDYFLARYYSSIQGRFTSPDPIFISEKQMANPQSWNLYGYVNNNPLAYLDPTGMERVRLGQHSDEEIDRLRKEKEQQIKQGKKDGTLTKEQRKQLEAERKTLGLEKEGNKLVNNLINRLSASERQGLQVSDFTLTTDPTGTDFMSDPNFVANTQDPQGLANASGKKAMFLFRGYSTEIFINTTTRNIKDMMSGDRDWITYGATAVKHEQSHRDKAYNEFQAYSEQKRVLEQFGPAAFSSREVYEGHRAFINRHIEQNRPKP